MEIKNRLTVNDIAYTLENNQIKKHFVRKLKVIVDEDKQEIFYLLSDDKWHKDEECFLYIGSILTFLKKNVDETETEKF